MNLLVCKTRAEAKFMIDALGLHLQQWDAGSFTGSVGGARFDRVVVFPYHTLSVHERDAQNQYIRIALATAVRHPEDDLWIVDPYEICRAPNAPRVEGSPHLAGEP